MLELVEKLLHYESGQMPPGEQRALFQELVDSGLAWRLQGHYGRAAARMIQAGELMPARNYVRA